MQSKTMKILVAVLAVVLAVPIVMSDISDADSDAPFDVTYTLKGETKTVHFDGPADKVAVFGYAATRTVFDVGCVDKIYGTDKYGQQALADAGSHATPVNIPFGYQESSLDMVYTQLIQAVEAGEFALDDTIIFTTFTTSAKTIIDRLEGAGFTNMVFYGSMKTYEDMARCVEEITAIVGGDPAPAERIRTTATHIKNVLEESNAEPVDAIFLRHHSSKGWGYGVSGSLAVSIIEATGGKNVAGDDDSGKTVYDESKILQLLEEYPDAVIVMDEVYLDSHEGTIDTFISEFMGGEQGNHTIVVMEKVWNNYDPEYADGLEAIASVLHPDLFTYDGELRVYEPAGDAPGSDGNVVYIVAGAVAAIAIALIVFLLVRRSTVSDKQ